jgi:hypothetical protein
MTNTNYVPGRRKVSGNVSKFPKVYHPFHGYVQRDGCSKHPHFTWYILMDERDKLNVKEFRAAVKKYNLEIRDCVPIKTNHRLLIYFRYKNHVSSVEIKTLEPVSKQIARSIKIIEEMIIDENNIRAIYAKYNAIEITEKIKDIENHCSDIEDSYARHNSIALLVGALYGYTPDDFITDEYNWLSLRPDLQKENEYLIIPGVTLLTCQVPSGLWAWGMHIHMIAGSGCYHGCGLWSRELYPDESSCRGCFLEYQIYDFSNKLSFNNSKSERAELRSKINALKVILSNEFSQIKLF